MTEKNKSKYHLLAFALVLVAGFLLVLFSSEKKDEEINVKSGAEFNETEYEKELEQRLKTLIEEIDGVGRVSVMVTLEGSALYTYAQDSSQDIDADGNLKKQATIVFSAKSASVKEAIVSGYTLPKIKGAAIVCEKKLTASLIEKVIGTASASLGISTDKIYVTN